MFKPQGALRGREVEGRRKRSCLLGLETGDTVMGPEHRQPIRRMGSGGRAFLAEGIGCVKTMK